MTYATTQDLIDRFGETELIRLTDRAGLGAIDQAVVDRALADADAEIDGYLTGRYQLPLSTAPTVLVRVGVDLARYALFGDRLTEVVKTRRDNAVNLLQGIARGNISLGLDGLSQPVQDATSVLTNAGKRVFGAGALADY